MGTPSQTNNTTIAIAPMTSFGTLGTPEWITLNPLEIGDPTAVPEMAVHDTIGPDNQYDAGALVRATAERQIQLGATAEVLDLLIPAALRGSWSGPISRRTSATRPTSATSAHFVVPSGTTIPASTLVQVSGARSAANRGTFLVSGSPSGTTVPTTPAPVAETFAAADNVCLEVCGFQFASGDLTITSSGGVTTLGTTTKDLTELGLASGQAIWIGSTAAAAYAFATAADYGPAVITSAPTANAITIAPLFGQTFSTDAGTSKTIRLMFGQSCRVVPKTSGDYREQFWQIETGLENLGSADATAWMYSENAAINTLTLSAPSNALATVTAAFKATDATKETSQRTNASSAIRCSRTVPFSTATADFTGRIYLYSAGTALTGYVSSMNLVLENQVSDNPAHGQVVSAFTSFGKVRVRLEVTAFLTEGGAIDAPRNATAVSANLIIRNSEGAYVFHVPEGRLGNGPANFPKNQVVTIDLPVMASKDGTWGTSLIVSKIPGCPALPARSA